MMTSFRLEAFLHAARLSHDVNNGSCGGDLFAQTLAGRLAHGAQYRPCTVHEGSSLQLKQKQVSLS